MSFQNGVALSATVHWLFDRHLISLTDDYRILVSHNKVPSELQSLFAKRLPDRIHLPADKRLWPHPAYIARHREHFASGELSPCRRRLGFQVSGLGIFAFDLRGSFDDAF